MNDIYKGMKQTDAAKKYGLLQSTFMTFIKKRKQFEEVVNSSHINPQGKQIMIATNENIDAAVLKRF